MIGINDMGCYLCGNKEYQRRAGSVRDNKEINVLEYNDCGLVYLSSFNHISNEHYENSGMDSNRKSNIGEWIQESKFDNNRRYDFVKEKIDNKAVLDFGCGVAGFLEIAKKSAKNVVGIELEKALQPSFKKRGLNVLPNLKDAQKEKTKYDIITAFHVVEHLQDPKEVLQELSQLLEKGGEIIVEVPNSDDALLTLYENKAFQNFTYWSQHLFLFNARTMMELVRQSGLKLNWIEHVQRYSLPNHLYWMSKGKPGGQKSWNFLSNKNIDLEYEKQLALIGKTDTIIVGISK